MNITAAVAEPTIFRYVNTTPEVRSEYTVINTDTSIKIHHLKL